MLQVEEVTVDFGGVRALDSVDLEVTEGGITGLIGPNGAGKTTTFNVVTGLQRPDRGKVLLGGRNITRERPRQRARLGLGRTFQRLELFGSLSARDNVLVALESHGMTGRKGRQIADDLLTRVGLSAVADRQADVLPTGMARLVELARALACEPKVLLLDEPSSGLDNAEGDRLGDLLTELAGLGMAILLVEHDMDLVMRICSKVFVLDFGRVISSGTPGEIRADPNVQAAYLGTGSVGVGP
ncbi:MAG TPA: ABC transporter ATP-binding protein [Acidimicrobiales bacterium]|nr:ABC transporter ATP-binding protein [Acidimicrobiales bacterium]